MAGILDELTAAVGTVSTLSQQVADPAQPNPPTEDRLAAVESFVTTWGPLIAKLSPLLEAV